MLYKQFKTITLLFILTCTIIISLTNCGFQLRGYALGKLNIKDILLDYNNSNTNNINLNRVFINNLTSEFNKQDIKVNTNQNIINPKNINNGYRLEILSTNYHKNIISTSSSQLTAQYKLSFNTAFNFYHGKKIILKNQNIITTKNYNYRQIILSLGYQESAITDELISEAIDNIIMQLIISIDKTKR